MDPLLPNPLTQEHCDCIDRCLASIPGTAKLIDALEKCGVDCTNAKEANEKHRAIATQLKATFFPTKP